MFAHFENQLQPHAKFELSLSQYFLNTVRKPKTQYNYVTTGSLRSPYDQAHLKVHL